MRAGKGRHSQGGFTYFSVLFLLVLLGLGLAGTGEAWSVASKRMRERELLWVGHQYARAIRAYHAQSPGVQVFPSRLEELLEDRRFPEPRRHLRKLYVDPISREDFETVLSNDGKIGGVRSRSDAEPMKKDNFPPKYRDFKGSTRYSEWLFVADVPGAPRKPGTEAEPAAPATGAASAAGGAAPAGTAGTPAPGGTAAPGGAAAPAVRPGPVISTTR
jgi:type II secretory pathway pseudopilin PulG